MKRTSWLAGLVMLAACGARMPPAPFPPSGAPEIDCIVDEDACELALDASSALLAHWETPLRIVVGWGRGRTFHAEVHACYPGGRYVLIDAIGPIGGPPGASLRADRPDPRAAAACA